MTQDNSRLIGIDQPSPVFGEGTQSEWNDPTEASVASENPIEEPDSDLQELAHSGKPNGQNPDATVQNNGQQTTVAATPKKIVEPYDIPRVREMEVREPNWLIDRFIVEQGIHIFSGQPGSMKSFLALFMGGALGAGLEIFGTK